MINKYVYEYKKLIIINDIKFVKYIAKLNNHYKKIDYL